MPSREELTLPGGHAEDEFGARGGPTELRRSLPPAARFVPVHDSRIAVGRPAFPIWEYHARAHDDLDLERLCWIRTGLERNGEVFGLAPSDLLDERIVTDLRRILDHFDALHRAGLIVWDPVRRVHREAGQRDAAEWREVVGADDLAKNAPGSEAISAGPGFAVRRLTSDDVDVLMRATVDNVNWNSPRFTRADVLTRPELSHYTCIERGRGDLGWLLTHRGEPAGVVWSLFLPEHSRGYGFVAAGIPELSLWIRPDLRHQGWGGDLVRRALRSSMQAGHPGVSLSVESGNRARELYAEHGFVDVPGRETDGVMLWTPPT